MLNSNVLNKERAGKRWWEGKVRDGKGKNWKEIKKAEKRMWNEGKAEDEGKCEENSDKRTKERRKNIE